MRKYKFIALGGMLGAILRYLIKNIHIFNYNGPIPINTLIINLSGSFVLALILTVAVEIFEFDYDLRLGIATGFLGAYTTFSTLCKETVNLINQGDYYPAIFYIGFSTIMGLAAAWLGVIFARKVVSKFQHSKKGSDDVKLEDQKEVD